MLNLRELEQKLDLALSQETEESLLNWLESVKHREMNIRKERNFLSKISWKGLTQEYINASEQVDKIFYANEIKGFGEFVIDMFKHSKMLNTLTGKPPCGHINNLFENNKAPKNPELFLCNIAP